MNIERIKKVALLVRDDGIKLHDGSSLGFNMSSWAWADTCGTTACIAGTCYAASNDYKAASNDYKKEYNDLCYFLSKKDAFFQAINSNSEQHARIYMGLNIKQATALFEPSYHNLNVNRNWTRKEVESIDNELIHQFVHNDYMINLKYHNINREMAYICMMNLIESGEVDWEKAINQYLDEL